MTKVILFKQTQNCVPCDILTTKIEGEGIEHKFDMIADLSTDKLHLKGGYSGGAVDLAVEHTVFSTPTTVKLADDGQVVARYTGTDLQEVLKVVNA